MDGTTAKTSVSGVACVEIVVGTVVDSRFGNFACPTGIPTADKQNVVQVVATIGELPGFPEAVCGAARQPQHRRGLQQWHVIYLRPRIDWRCPLHQRQYGVCVLLFFSPVNAALLASRHGFDALGINDAVTRLWFSSALFPGLLNQMLENGVPESGYSRASIEAVHGGIGREIMG